MNITKADIAKVNSVEGYPDADIGSIEGISVPPFYTACPNPYITQFIRENGKAYNEDEDDYHREPFAFDVSEGKNDPIYNAHSYHTKVPYKAIMRYILHYTKPGDIVFDGFCGTGMTGVAAQMCECPDAEFKADVENEMGSEKVEWGARKAIISDLSPAATFIAYNYNYPVDPSLYLETVDNILSRCEEKYSWMFETQHVDGQGKSVLGADGKVLKGVINNTLWSDVFVCPSCSSEFVFWNVAFDSDNRKLRDKFSCPHCNSLISKKDCEHSFESFYDSALGETCSIIKQEPVLINYSFANKRYEKKPDSLDIERETKIKNANLSEWFPSSRMPEGKESRRNDKYGITHVHHFYHKSALAEMAYIWHASSELDTEMGNHVKFAHSAANQYLSKMRRFRPDKKGGGPLSGTLYVSSLATPPNPALSIRRNAGSVAEAMSREKFSRGNVCISTQSLTDVTLIPENSIDYIFTDPPFGGNLNYSELNFIWEDWLKVHTTNNKEAIVCDTQGKGLLEYQELMEKCFSSYYKVLKPSHWITIEFHNSQNAVWNAITEALMQVGFIVADVRILDKKQSSFKQVNNVNAVKQDLVISAYKPTASFVRKFTENAGDVQMVWEFIRQHLRHVPVAPDGNHDGQIDLVAERQDYLLFDRMVAWHIVNGIPVPVDATTFYKGLREYFIERDGMFFLPDQVNEYDEKRSYMSLESQQLSFVVTDEKNAIGWLNYMLNNGAKTYQELQPLYLQELHLSKQEKMPELLDILKENFVQDEKGAWYVPDLSNAADLAKIRRKALLKEFNDSCVPGKAKLKVFRMEAIRAGFDECWKNRDYKTIVSVGQKLPESALQEDPALLMYYDNASSRLQ